MVSVTDFEMQNVYLKVCLKAQSRLDYENPKDKKKNVCEPIVILRYSLEALWQNECCGKAFLAVVLEAWYFLRREVYFVPYEIFFYSFTL